MDLTTPRLEDGKVDKRLDIVVTIISGEELSLAYLLLNIVYDFVTLMFY